MAESWIEVLIIAWEVFLAVSVDQRRQLFYKLQLDAVSVLSWTEFHHWFTNSIQDVNATIDHFSTLGHYMDRVYYPKELSSDVRLLEYVEYSFEIARMSTETDEMNRIEWRINIY